jgi:hypothetical protein
MACGTPAHSEGETEASQMLASGSLGATTLALGPHSVFTVVGPTNIPASCLMLRDEVR